MRVGCSYDDSYPGSNQRRVFFTIELTDGRYVDIMISEESHAIYAIQNEDGSVVYGNKQTYPGYVFDEKMAIALAVHEYEKEFGEITWYGNF